MRREPTFARAYVGLADALQLAGSPSTGMADARARMSRARSAAEQALRLDDQLAEAHTALGGVQFFGDRDAAAAERSFKRAIALNPNYPVAHQWYAVLLSERGRDAKRASTPNWPSALDPMEATMHQARGLVHYYARASATPSTAERKALEIRPQLPFARVVLVKALVMGGRSCGRGCGVRRGQRALEPDQTDLLLTCGIALHRHGDRAIGRRRSAGCSRSGRRPSRRSRSGMPRPATSAAPLIADAAARERQPAAEPRVRSVVRRAPRRRAIREIGRRLDWN